MFEKVVGLPELLLPNQEPVNVLCQLSSKWHSVRGGVLVKWYPSTTWSWLTLSFPLFVLGLLLNYTRILYQYKSLVFPERNPGDFLW